MLLRIEDHDRSRSRTEFEAGILDDLDWLGYRPDIFPTDAYRAGRCDGRQSDRGDICSRAFEVLRDQGLVYACDCSRRVAAQSISAAARSSAEPPELRYPGLCRDKQLPIVDGFGWRLRVDPGVEEFEDARLGLQRQDPYEQCGDVLLRDRHGNWTYQFAVAVDDWQQNIGYVIRGIDLLASTGRQIQIARLLGRSSRRSLSPSADHEDGRSEVEQVGW